MCSTTVLGVERYCMRFIYYMFLVNVKSYYAHLLLSYFIVNFIFVFSYFIFVVFLSISSLRVWYAHKMERERIMFMYNVHTMHIHFCVHLRVNFNRVKTSINSWNSRNVVDSLLMWSHSSCAIITHPYNVSLTHKLNTFSLINCAFQCYALNFKHSSRPRYRMQFMNASG